MGRCWAGRGPQAALARRVWRRAGRAVRRSAWRSFPLRASDSDEAAAVGARGGGSPQVQDTSNTHTHTRPPPSPCVAYYIISYYIIQYYIIQYYVASRRAPYRACRPPALRPADGARAARRGRGRRAPDIFTARSAVLRQQVKMARSESVRVGPSRSKPRAARACRGRACAATVSVRAQREARLERPPADPPLLRSKNLAA